jgi:hypothetical protein
MTSDLAKGTSSAMSWNLMALVRSTFDAALSRFGLKSKTVPPRGLKDALLNFSCTNKIFTVSLKDCMLSVFPEENDIALCFMVLAHDNSLSLTAKLDPKQLEKHRNMVIKSAQLTETQRWILFLDVIHEAIEKGTFSLEKNKLHIECASATLVIPMAKNTTMNSQNSSLIFGMYRSSLVTIEKINEQDEKIAELAQEIERLRAAKESETNLDGTDLDESDDIPIQRVLNLLKRWRDGPLSNRRDSVQVDFITKVLRSDSLYDISAREEEDHDVKGYFVNEGLVKVFSPDTNRRASENWGRVRAYSKVFSLAKQIRRDSEFPAEVQQALAGIDSFDWDVFEMNTVSDNRPLYYTALYLFNRHDLFNKCHINQTHFKNFAQEIESGYKNNPYHNSMHATDVLQTVHMFISKSSKAAALSDLQKFAAFVAAMVHDYEHPGVSNTFEKALETDRAVVYNDQSILENFHCSQAFRVMAKPGCNILDGLKKDERRFFRDTMINLILATDITKHGEIIGKLKATIIAEFNNESDEHIAMMLKMFVKCADVGNPAKTLKQSKLWAERVMAEFYDQGDREKELSIPVSNMMDRDRPNMPKAQEGFINYIVRPLFECLAQFDTEFKCLLDNVNANRDYWREEMVLDGGSTPVK